MNITMLQKCAVALLLIFDCRAASASCIDELRANVDLFKEEAKRVIWMQNTAKIDAIRVMIGTLAPDSDGEYEPAQDLVRINARVCEKPKPKRDFVIAHEIGHAVSLILYPEMLTEVVSKRYRYGVGRHEDMANQYAARIYPRDQIEALLKIWDEGCADGAPQQCINAKSWRAGMVQ